MQGVVKAFDPSTGSGSVVDEKTLGDIDFADTAWPSSVFRIIRQGQRVNFDLDEAGKATNLRFGSEPDMNTPRPA